MPMQVAMSNPQPAEQIRVHLVTPEYFEALGVAALYGRALGAEDAKQSGESPAAVLSYAFWKRRFQEDRKTVGRSIALHGHHFTVVGVMPEGFNGISVDTAPDALVPLRAFPLLSPDAPTSTIANTPFELAGRLRPGVTLE